MSWPRNIFSCGVVVLFAHVTVADIMVQLNINQPINDVSEKFVSFSMKPEDLFKALDSSNRKAMTRMASMLSHSHVKFVGDYYFAAKKEGIRLRNPTKIVWKGFNKWTKAVNWSMIIPVPYKPDNWDPMETLKILNTSQMVDIDEAIWQLGTDFGFSRASHYVSELKTFNVMVDSFKQTVVNWQAMGADISAGSSPEETRHYVAMSRDLNAAYGWIQSDEMFSSNNGASDLDNQDPALRVLFKSKVPVWLSIPKRKTSTSLLHMNNAVTDGLRWAQTMGEAANIGFDTIFKPLSLDDMEVPKYDFYVTVLFKKIMGSRVYPARPLNFFGSYNKLYTHCANMVSGGLAFMVVNIHDQPLQMAIRSMNKLQDTEVWQYTLTIHNGQVMLNNAQLFTNSTLIPEVRRKNSLSMLQLQTPGLSVSFWVLPNANLEHCHFTQVQMPVMSANDNNNINKVKRNSSSDRLLKELIKESTKSSHIPSFPLVDLIRRHRRSVDNEDRLKRFVLEGPRDKVKPFANLPATLVENIKAPFKKNIYSPERKISALDWLSNIIQKPLGLKLPLLKRNARHSDSEKGPFFMTPDGKKTTFTKKITAIKNTEKKPTKIILEDQEFDEENFFKNVGQLPETDNVRIPEGDIFLNNIASVNSDDRDQELTIETNKFNKVRIQKNDIVNEMKPLRLLPTEFFETLPSKLVQPLPSNDNLGSALNSLLFPELFGHSFERNNGNKFAKNLHFEEVGRHLEIPSNVNNGENPLKDEINSTKNVLNNRAGVSDEYNTENTEETDISHDGENTFKETKAKVVDQIAEKEELPWWDFSSKRLKRSLNTLYETNSWRNNKISKHVDSITTDDQLSPARLHPFELKAEEVVRSTNNKHSKQEEDGDDVSIGGIIVRTIKEQFTKFMDIFSHHANYWYYSLKKQKDREIERTTSTTTERNHIHKDNDSRETVDNAMKLL